MADHLDFVPTRDASCGKPLSPVIRDAWAHTLCCAGNMPLSRAHVIVDAVWSEMAKRFTEADLGLALMQVPESIGGSPLRH